MTLREGRVKSRHARHQGRGQPGRLAAVRRTTLKSDGILRVFVGLECVPAGVERYLPYSTTPSETGEGAFGLSRRRVERAIT